MPDEFSWEEDDYTHPVSILNGDEKAVDLPNAPPKLRPISVVATGVNIQHTKIKHLAFLDHARIPVTFTYLLCGKNTKLMPLDIDRVDIDLMDFDRWFMNMAENNIVCENINPRDLRIKVHNPVMVPGGASLHLMFFLTLISKLNAFLEKENSRCVCFKSQLHYNERDTLQFVGDWRTYLPQSEKFWWNRADGSFNDSTIIEGTSQRLLGSLS